MIINLKSETDLSGFYVVYEGSTNLEKKGWFGISHLMEHLMCKNFDHLQEDFDRDGIDWNAYTSSNEIVFYLTGLEDKVNKWKGEFMDLLGEFNVTKEQFENERNIVLEEYMDCFNDQTQTHMLNLSRKLFNDYDPIGLKEDLEKDLVDKDIIILIGSSSSGNSPESENYTLSIRRSHSVIKSILKEINCECSEDIRREIYWVYNIVQACYISIVLLFAIIALITVLANRSM